MVSQVGITLQHHIVYSGSSGLRVEPNDGADEALAWQGMNVSSYVQTPTFTNFGPYTEDGYHYGYARIGITVNVNGNLAHMTGSYDQGVFKWDSETDGQWVAIGTVLVDDWLLTNTYNSSFGDYFWQVTQKATAPHDGELVIPRHPSGTPSNRQNVCVSTVVGTVSSPRICTKTYPME